MFNIPLAHILALDRPKIQLIKLLMSKKCIAWEVASNNPCEQVHASCAALSLSFLPIKKHLPTAIKATPHSKKNGQQWRRQFFSNATSLPEILEEGLREHAWMEAWPPSRRVWSPDSRRLALQTTVRYGCFPLAWLPP